MTQADTAVEERIIAIVADQAMVETDDVTPDTKLEDLGIDSLGVVEIVFAIEESFDISVPFNANDPAQSDFDVRDVRSIAGAVSRLLADRDG